MSTSCKTCEWTSWYSGRTSLMAGNSALWSRSSDTHPAFMPGVTAFLKRSIVEFPAAAHDKRHGLLLFWSRLELVFEGFA